MASLRRLNRRLLRWERYDGKTMHTAPVDLGRAVLPGHMRAIVAVEAEDVRRFWAQTREIHLAGMPDDDYCLSCDDYLDVCDCADDPPGRPVVTVAVVEGVL